MYNQNIIENQILREKETSESILKSHQHFSAPKRIKKTREDHM
jgi:hypothetical protein